MIAKVLLAGVIAAILVAGGCSSSGQQSSQSPTAASGLGPVTPTAVSYPSLEALWSAVSAAGGPAAEPIHFSDSQRRLPTASQYGAVLVAMPGGTLALKDGTLATNVVCAVFPDAVPETERDQYGGWLAQGLGWPSMPQLTGPNWVLWCVDRRALLDLRGAIGGQFTQATAPSAGSQ